LIYLYVIALRDAFIQTSNGRSPRSLEFSVVFAFLRLIFELHGRYNYLFNNTVFTQADLGVQRRVTLKWIFNKWDEEAWTGLF